MMLVRLKLVPENKGGRSWAKWPDGAQKYMTSGNLTSGEAKGQVWSVVVYFDVAPRSGLTRCEFLVDVPFKLVEGDTFDLAEGRRVVACCEVVEP